MLLSDEAEVLGQAFAQAVIDEDWKALSECLAEAARVTPEQLKAGLPKVSGFEVELILD